MTRERVIEKVKKLLALGESDNEHEAAAATARAHALMEKHEIAEAMLGEEQDEEPVGEHELGDEGQRRSGWRGSLANVLADANGCRAFTRTRHHPRRVRLQLVGRPRDVERVRVLFGACVAEIDRLAAKETRGRGARFARAFRYGCVVAIEKAVTAEKQRLREEMLEDARRQGRLVDFKRALVAVDNRGQDAGAWVKANLHLTPARQPAPIDGQGFQAGSRAGSGIYRGVGQGKLQGPSSRRLR